MLTSFQHPDIMSKTLTDLQAEIHLKIPENLAFFQGHFKDMPVVPGVVQLHWVVDLVKEFFKIIPSITHGSQIKFMRLMQPNDMPTLRLTIDPAATLITYKYYEGETTYSSGKLTYDT